MAIKTILISSCLSLSACVSVQASTTVLPKLSAICPTVCAIDTLTSDEQRKRQRIEKAIGKTATDTLAKGSYDINPFTKEFLSERYNPYSYSVQDEKDKKKQIEEQMGLQGYNPYLKRGSQKWYNKFYVGLFVGFNRIAPLDQRINYDLTMVYGGMLGYQFNRLHSLRLTGNFGHYTSDNMPESMWNAAIDISYAFNLSNYMYGVKEKRWLDFSPVIGVGINMSKNSVWNNKSLFGRFGINIDRALSGNSHIFVEPYMTVTNDGFNGKGGNNPRRYDIEWGIYGGMRLDLRPDTAKQKLYMPDFNPNMFVDFAIGPNMYWVKSHPDQTFTKTIGTNYQLMFGKWFDPIFGARIGLMSGDFFWRHDKQNSIGFSNATISEESKTYYRGGLAAARFEIMMRPMNFFTKWREMPHKFELNVSAGVDLGAYYKINVRNYGEVNKMYIGYTMAFDVLYRIAPDTWLFIEPRALIANYTIKGAEYGNEGNYRDKLGSFNFGVRVQRPTKEERDNMFDGEFDPHWEVGIIGGTNKYISKNRIVTKEHMNWLAGVNVAYSFTPLHSVMAEVEYSQMYQQFIGSYEIKSGTNMLHYGGLITRTYNIGTVKAAYRLNITDLFMNSNYDRRRFNLYGFIGPSFSYHFKTNYKVSEDILSGGTSTPVAKGKDFAGTSSVGIFGGFIASYHLTNHFAVNIRPEATMMLQGDFILPHYRTFIMKVDAGLTYTF